MNIQKYLDLFELRTEKKNSIGQEVREPWHCFTSKAIDSKSLEYNKMSNLIRESDLDNDSAYTFTVEALEAMEEITNEGTANIQDMLEGNGDKIHTFSEPPIYTSDLMEWVSKGTNYTFVDEVLKEYGNDIYNESTGILGIIGMAYSLAWEEHYYKVLEVVK